MNRARFDASIQYTSLRPRHIGAMTNIELSHLTPRPGGSDAAQKTRPVPCAGLFGWRKDAALPTPSNDTPKKAGRDYPLG
jgi:hypothetical protein